MTPADVVERMDETEHSEPFRCSVCRELIELVADRIAGRYYKVAAFNHRDHECPVVGWEIREIGAPFRCKCGTQVQANHWGRRWDWATGKRHRCTWQPPSDDLMPLPPGPQRPVLHFVGPDGSPR